MTHGLEKNQKVEPEESRGRDPLGQNLGHPAGRLERDRSIEKLLAESHQTVKIRVENLPIEKVRVESQLIENRVKCRLKNRNLRVDLRNHGLRLNHLKLLEYLRQKNPSQSPSKLSLK